MTCVVGPASSSSSSTSLPLPLPLPLPLRRSAEEDPLMRSHVSLAALGDVVAANAASLRELLGVDFDMYERTEQGLAELQDLLAAAPALEVLDAYVSSDCCLTTRRLLRNEPPFGPLRMYGLAIERDASGADFRAILPELTRHRSLSALYVHTFGETPLPTDEVDLVVDAALAARRPRRARRWAPPTRRRPRPARPRRRSRPHRRCAPRCPRPPRPRPLRRCRARRSGGRCRTLTSASRWGAASSATCTWRARSRANTSSLSKSCSRRVPFSCLGCARSAHAAHRATARGVSCHRPRDAAACGPRGRCAEAARLRPPYMCSVKPYETI